MMLALVAAIAISATTTAPSTLGQNAIGVAVGQVALVVAPAIEATPAANSPAAMDTSPATPCTATTGTNSASAMTHTTSAIAQQTASAYAKTNPAPDATESEGRYLAVTEVAGHFANTAALVG